MDSNTLQLIGAGALIAALGAGAVVEQRLRHRAPSAKGNPLAKVTLRGVSASDLAERNAFAVARAKELRALPWGQAAIGERHLAEELYQRARGALVDAEGDYRKYPAIVRSVLACPLDLGYSLCAQVVQLYAFFSGDNYAPEGIRAALTFTSDAVKHDPASVDAWITRAQVACTMLDMRYKAIADYALKRAQALNPNHPRLPNAESSFAKRWLRQDQYEAAVRRIITYATDPNDRRAGFDRLANLQRETGRLDDAIATYQQLFAEQPQGTAWTWHNYSIALLQAKRYQEALDASNHALAFFEFTVARNINNKARAGLSLPSSSAERATDGDALI
ncbi:MAG TPA: tetratricopeptide repeat protein [Ktedonobacterales bacterium]|nr:tetratricopeptide repeat protein [Ktedonobacterales bacterium]